MIIEEYKIISFKDRLINYILPYYDDINLFSKKLDTTTPDHRDPYFFFLTFFMERENYYFFPNYQWLTDT